MLRPTATDVKVLDNYKLHIKFDNGEEKIFDASKLFDRIPFLPLKDKAVFKNVEINGISIAWNEDIDVCPDELYYLSVPA
jgi:antitoxin component YwqK of YwqJK toxin-antitoxin module